MAALAWRQPSRAQSLLAGAGIAFLAGALGCSPMGYAGAATLGLAATAAPVMILRPEHS